MKKIKVRIFEDERYPDYSIYKADEFEDGWGKVIELTEKQFKRVKKAIEEYEKIQDFLESKFDSCE